MATLQQIADKSVEVRTLTDQAMVLVAELRANQNDPALSDQVLARLESVRSDLNGIVNPG